MATTDKVREDRLRRKLDRMGFVLMKSKARDPDALTYGKYQIADVDSRSVVAGFGNARYGYSFDLDDVERWITESRGVPQTQADRNQPVTDRSVVVVPGQVPTRKKSTPRKKRRTLHREARTPDPPRLRALQRQP